MLRIVLGLLVLQSTAFGYGRVYGEFFRKQKGFDRYECLPEVGSRDPEFYVLYNLRCELCDKGRRYCAGGTVEKGFSGENEMNVRIFEEYND